MNHTDKILEISKELGLTHIGSCLSVLPILEEIYAKKKPEDKVILDNAHAHLAHLMFTNPTQAKELIELWGIHCDRRAGCDALGGSLGHGIGISIGYALSNPDITVYCIVSDGSMMEGSNMEALRIADELGLKNLEIHCNFNGYTAVAKVDPLKVWNRLNFYRGRLILHKTSNTEQFDGLKGHYMKI